MSDSLVSLLEQISGARDRIAHVEPLAARPARYAEPAAPLPPALAGALAARGIARLYAHQAAALDAARAGAYIGVVTATASGKTLCYQLPIIEALLEEPESRALLLFPTKALAHDQLRSLDALIEALHAAHAPSSLMAAAFDGDTPRPQRDRIRARAQIILSNPDMLHRSLLPDHRRWAGWLARLRYVVLDEAHVYRGVFGTHVALIVRRLRRLCAHYGSAPQFICCSATSANPAEHLAALIGDPVTLIADDSAPQGPRTFVFWNPPPLEPRIPSRNPAIRPGLERAGSPLVAAGSSRDGRRRSTNVETAQLLAALARSGIKTLAFARTRRGAELILRYAREALESPPEPGRRRQSSPLPPEVLAAYRAGYRPEDRRALERAFLQGELRGLVSTNALELGVDIGGVDAVVIGGYPGSVASTWQQAGRAGRALGASMAVLVAQDDPLDQFYMRHPEQFFARPHEQARVALQNPYILSDQLCCASAELPLHEADTLWFGETMPALRDWMLRHGRLVELADGRATSVANRPAADVNIRSADGAPIELRDAEDGRLIEQIPATRAPFEVFPGAVYLHQGDSYLVSELGPRHALARRAQLDYYTQPIEQTEIAVERVRERRQLGPATLYLGVVHVTRQVTGYRRKAHYSEALLSEHDLSLPPQTFRTVAVWWTVADALCQQVEQACGDALDGLHALEHACIGLLPLFAQCDRADIGGLSTDRHPDTGAATIFVYDGVPGGVGISEVGYEQAEAWWAQTRALLAECPCAEGCPGCIQSPKCGNGNQHLSKIGAVALAALLLGQPIPARDLGAPGAAPAGEPSALLAELWGRIERARATPPGPRRAALLVALRYRLGVERAQLNAEALAAIEKEVARLLS